MSLLQRRQRLLFTDTRKWQGMVTSANQCPL